MQHKLLAFALPLALLLAGCADNGGAKVSSSPSLKQAEKAANDLDVQATETTGVIRGVVVDQAFRPIAGAAIDLRGAGNTTTTEEGAFGFDGLEPGTYFLTASKADYTTIQQAVEVVAGVSDPDAIKVLLTAVPRGTPFVEALQATIFITGSFNVEGVVRFTSGDLVGNEGNYNFNIDISPNGTVAQAELDWSSTSPLGVNALSYCETESSGDTLDGHSARGPNPLVLRLNATEDGNSADSIYCDFWAAGSSGTPVGVIYNTKLDCFVHVFHNFMPRDDWIFSRDGDYPVP